MIRNKEDLRRYLKTEKDLYIPQSRHDRLVGVVTGDMKRKIFRFIRYLRYEEYHHNQSGILHQILRVYYWRKRNLLGNKLGIEIWDNTIDEGLKIYHAGSIAVNSAARIGKNCIMHGRNCIGNNGKTPECPVIGNNVRLGMGAMVFGDVTIADDVTIAAGAVVVHSVLEAGVTVAGVPARKVSKS